MAGSPVPVLLCISIAFKIPSLRGNACECILLHINICLWSPLICLWSILYFNSCSSGKCAFSYVVNQLIIWNSNSLAKWVLFVITCCGFVNVGYTSSWFINIVARNTCIMLWKRGSCARLYILRHMFYVTKDVHVRVSLLYGCM